MIKIEPHLHAIGGSNCADANSHLTVDKYLAEGYGGIVVTTHISVFNFNNVHLGKSDTEKIEYFFKVYDEFSAIAKEKGIKTFFGAEVRSLPTKVEYALIGFDREFLFAHPKLFELSQQQLFELAEKHNIFMFQTHPFREGVEVGDPRFMHGAESFNGHYHHDNNNLLATDFCEKNNLIKMSGTDYHHNDQEVVGGIYIPDNISNERQLADFLLKGKFDIIVDEEKYQRVRKEYLLEKENKNGN